MTAEAALADGRVAAEARMIDRCSISRPGGAAVFDPVTGNYTDPAGTVVYAGACEVQVNGLTGQDVEVGGAEVGLRRLTVKIPAAVTGVRPDDLVTMTGAALDPDLVGRVFRVEVAEAKTFATCRRLQVEEVQ